MGIVLTRLTEAKVDLHKVGIILIMDPAQLLPIGDVPLWSTKLTRKNGTDMNINSLHGTVDFRDVFGMKRLSECSNYSLYKINESCKNPSEAQRKQMSQFRFAALQVIIAFS